MIKMIGELNGIKVGIDEGQLCIAVGNEDTILDLVRETVKLNKVFFDQQGPAFVHSGGGNMLKYLVGDKLAFAVKLGLISCEEGQLLLKEVKSWS